MTFRERGQPLAMRGEQRLVGSDDRFAGGKRGLDGKLGGACGAADNLDQHVDCRIACQRRGIANPTKLANIEIAFLAARSGADRDDFDAATAAGDQLVAAAFQVLQHGAADSAESGKTDFQRFSHDAVARIGMERDATKA